jgi:hypothetical protein
LWKGIHGNGKNTYKMKIQEFALKISITVCPSHIVEPLHLKKWWRQRGVGELEKWFVSGKAIDYNYEIDWKKISDHKKSMWYDSQNFQINMGHEYSKRQG